jgi:hypothetical protein
MVTDAGTSTLKASSSTAASASRGISANMLAAIATSISCLSASVSIWTGGDWCWFDRPPLRRIA